MTRGCRPLLRWAGSKRQLLPLLGTYWQSDNVRYVEPFAGSCSLFFRLQPDVALLADKNEDLIETYRVLCRSPKALHRSVSGLVASKWLYLAVRSLQPANLSRLERAARFVYLNRNCFNGIYRTNTLGEFNVPFASCKQGRIPSLEEFVVCSDLLQRASLRAWDFGTTLRHCQRGDFVYLDPPYVVAERRVFRQYGPRPFNREDLTRLRRHLERLDARGVKFALSYADCRESRDLASAWHFRRVQVRRNVAGFSGKRKRSVELIITNTHTKRLESTDAR